MMMISWEFTAPVWWALAPRTTMPSALSSTTCMKTCPGRAACGAAGRGRPWGRSWRRRRSVVFLNKFQILQETFCHIPCRTFWSMSWVTMDRAFRASMPTQRWKQQPVKRAEQPAHLAFFDQVAGTLMNMGEAVDLFAAKVGGGGHQVLVFGLDGPVRRSA